MWYFMIVAKSATSPLASIDMRRVFYGSSGLLLLFTGLAKVYSAFGPMRLLQSPDPLLGLDYRTVLLWASALELAVVFVLWSARTDLVKCLSLNAV